MSESLVIDWVGGNCPVQAEGTIDGFRFDFRARGSTWSFEVYDGGKEPWYTHEKYSDEPYAAGWMTEDEARAFIEQGAQQFRNRNAQPNDDGQPDEAQEWHDYDQDC